jgi:HEAT repeat protein
MSGLDGGDSVSVLVKSLKHSKAAVRKSAALTLKNLGPEAEAALPALALALNDPDPETAGAVTQALGQIGPPAVPALIQALSIPHKQARREAARALGKLGAAARSAVPALQKTLTDADMKVRMAAAQALGAMGPDADEAVPGLIEALGDKNLIFCRLAAQALSCIGPRALPALLEVLGQTRDGYVQREATWALRRLADANPNLAPALAERSDLDKLAASSKLSPQQSAAADRPNAKDVATIAVSIEPTPKQTNAEA